MPAGSILPVTIHNGKLYFLFGKENPMEDSSHGFSDFGGGKEKGESFYSAALREGSEELTGFFGSKTQLKSRIRKTGGTLPMPYFFDNGHEYRVHVIYTEYNEELVKHFNDNHRFLWNHMDKHTLNRSKLFEKIEIRWVCETQLRAFLPQMRHFYRDIVLRILLPNLENIRKFIAPKTRFDTRRCVETARKKTGKHRKNGKTRRIYGG